MKHLLIILGLFLTQDSIAQVTSHNFTFETTEYSSKGMPLLTKHPISYSNIRSAKRLDTGYTGFLVELLTVPRPLKSNHHLFSLFGNIYYQKVPKKGYVYYIPLGFKHQKSAQHYVEQTILPKVPKARLIKF